MRSAQSLAERHLLCLIGVPPPCPAAAPPPPPRILATEIGSRIAEYNGSFVKVLEAAVAAVAKA